MATVTATATLPRPEERDLDTVAAAQRRDRWVTALFATTAFMASGLLFAAEPMVARMLLPHLGGSAAVWNTALVFFQAALLVGYLVAHLSLRRVRAPRHVVLQVGLLVAAGVTLPIAVPSGWVAPTSTNPAAWTLLVLTVAVGGPFLALSTMSPTLQRWLASTDHRAAHDPYFLYAAGNAGSLIALLAYPLLLEPGLGLTAQARGWGVLYALLVALTVACAVVVRRRSQAVHFERPADGPAVGMGDRLRWIALSAVPSALLLGVTRHIATDIASVPLLWVVPLALYLTTFIAAFGAPSEKVARWGGLAATMLVVPALVTGFGSLDLGVAGVALHLLAFTAVATAAHGHLAALRPRSHDLTGYYLAVSIGGVTGGVLAALVAPVVFESVTEYPLALALGIAAVAPARGRFLTREASRALGAAALVSVVALLVGWAVVVLLTAVGAGTALIVRRTPVAAAALLVVVVLLVAEVGRSDLLASERTFFGVSRVEQSGDAHVYSNGTTVHGVQRVGGPGEQDPLSYYSAESGVGRVIRELGASDEVDVGLVGLGVGTLASYGRPGDRLTFYEIDPAVVRIAQDPSLFTYLHYSQADVDVEVGDGRLLLERSSGAEHDLLVLDAFSSDAIPVHLLTREAFAVYRERMADGGVLAVHVSNRYFDLVPVVAALASDAGMEVRVRHHQPGASDDDRVSASTWLAMSADREVVEHLAAGGGWDTPEPAGEVWTDDHADLLSTLDW